MMAAAAHNKAVLKDHPSLNQIIAGINKTRSYAYDLGAQNNDATSAIDNNGIFGKFRNRITIYAAMATRTMVNDRLPVPE